MEEDFETINGSTFWKKFFSLLQENPEMLVADVVFEDENGIYHEIKEIVIDRKVALAMIALKEKEGE